MVYLNFRRHAQIGLTTWCFKCAPDHSGDFKREWSSRAGFKAQSLAAEIPSLCDCRTILLLGTCLHLCYSGIEGKRWMYFFYLNTDIRYLFLPLVSHALWVWALLKIILYHEEWSMPFPKKICPSSLEFWREEVTNIPTFEYNTIVWCVWCGFTHYQHIAYLFPLDSYEIERWNLN